MMETRIIRHTIAGILLALAVSGIAVSASLAANPKPAQLDDAVRANLARIEDYLNGLTTIDSKFVQLSQEGFAEGRLRLSRPGDMRIEYQPPVPVLIVASGFVVMYYDHKLEQTTFLPIFETPAYFLLRERIDLSDGLTVTNFEREASAIRVSVVETDAPDAGEVTIVFEDRPLRLVKWRVVDAQQNVIDVALVDPKFGVEFKNRSSLFSTADPTFGSNSLGGSE
jgi:outer membrane lipoprotein-sorting protein